MHNTKDLVLEFDHHDVLDHLNHSTKQLLTRFLPVEAAAALMTVFDVCDGFCPNFPMILQMKRSMNSSCLIVFSTNIAHSDRKIYHPLSERYLANNQRPRGLMTLARKLLMVNYVDYSFLLDTLNFVETATIDLDFENEKDLQVVHHHHHHYLHHHFRYQMKEQYNHFLLNHFSILFEKQIKQF